jgi:ribosomal protein L19
MNLIQTLEQEEIARLGKTIPEFAPGDTVIVNVSVIEDPLAVAFAEITSVVVDIDTTVAPDGIPVPDTD